MSCFHVGETCANWKTITSISELSKLSDLKSIKTESKKQPLFEVNTACSQHTFFSHETSHGYHETSSSDRKVRLHIGLSALFLTNNSDATTTTMIVLENILETVLLCV